MMHVYWFDGSTPKSRAFIVSFAKPTFVTRIERTYVIDHHHLAFDNVVVPTVATNTFLHTHAETVLGQAAMYLNARIPELTSVSVSSPEELDDFEPIIDEYTGNVLYVEDKRSPDFNGDRETMEYQGLDPDARGPFVFGSGAGGGGMIRPAWGASSRETFSWKRLWAEQQE